jgi:hypothetical protein
MRACSRGILSPVSVTFAVIILTLTLGCAAIAKDHIVSKPTIMPTADWNVEQGCGYEHCGPPPVDFLVGKDLSIRIETHNDKAKNRFALWLIFLPKKNFEVRFNPSFVIVELTDGKKLRADGYPCSGKIWDPTYRRSIPALTSSAVVPKGGCFLLFFDSPPPAVDDEFRMRVGGVTLGGEPISIPEVTFRKGISRW